MSYLIPPWLQVFLAVAEHKSFNRAARALLLSQPAVSQRIRQLEKVLGVPLFRRTPRGVELTPAGEELLYYARQVRRLLMVAESRITDPASTQQRRLLLGMTPTLTLYRLPLWLKHFHEQYPHVRVQVRTDTTPRLVQSVRYHNLYLALVEGELPHEQGVSSLLLGEIPFVILAPAQEPWVRHRQLPLEALDQQPFISRPPEAQTRRWLDVLFTAKGVRPNLVAELDSPESIKRAVAQGVGVTLLPRCMVEDVDARALHVIDIMPDPPRRYLKAIWPAGLPLHPLAQAFLRALQPFFPTLRAWFREGHATTAEELRWPAPSAPPPLP